MLNTLLGDIWLILLPFWDLFFSTSCVTMVMFPDKTWTCFVVQKLRITQNNTQILLHSLGLWCPCSKMSDPSCYYLTLCEHMQTQPFLTFDFICTIQNTTDMPLARHRKCFLLRDGNKKNLKERQLWGVTYQDVIKNFSGSYQILKLGKCNLGWTKTQHITTWNVCLIKLNQNAKTMCEKLNAVYESVACRTTFSRND